MTPEEFQDLVMYECDKHEVQIHTSDKDHVVMVENGNEIKVNGFFDDSWGDDERPVLAWNTGREFEQWFPILVHEYNHMRQWVEEDSFWIAMDYTSDYFEWLSGDIELTERDALDCCTTYALMEFNCDIRVVEMIKEFELPLDVDNYIQTAHAYAWFYFWSLENKSWYVIDHEPYRTQAIVEAMPTTLPDITKGEFTYDFYKRHYKSIFDRHMVAAAQNTLYTE
jgi:hypothetical protein